MNETEAVSDIRDMRWSGDAVVTNVEAANRQLSTAIRMYFACDDLVSVHTLACASREIFEKHCRRQGKQSVADWSLGQGVFSSDRQLWHVLNYERNFFKHAAATLTDGVVLSEKSVYMALLIANEDCRSICGDKLPGEVIAFRFWSAFRYFVTTGKIEFRPDPDEQAYRRFIEIQPDFQHLAWSEQRHFGQYVSECVMLSISNATPD